MHQVKRLEVATVARVGVHNSQTATLSGMAVVTVVQPYIPQYRVPLFDGLRAALGRDDHELRLVTGSPDKVQMLRHDAAPQQPGQIVVQSHHISFKHASLGWKRVSPALGEASLVIAQLGAGLIDTHLLLMEMRGRVALWGHGHPATGSSGMLDGALERWQMRQANHFFAYTTSGATAARAAGVAGDSITVLQNTIDTDALRAACLDVPEDAAKSFRESLCLGDGPICAYIGALDGPKRMDFLLHAADGIARALPGFQLVIAGDGAHRAMVEDSVAARPHINYVGKVDDAGKAKISSAASLLLNPGRVGLSAVDSFALQLPIVTTDWPHHAPEFSYLRHNQNAVVAADNADAFAQAAIGLLRDPARVAMLKAGCQASGEEYSMSAMVDRFATGIHKALESASKA